jgi:cytoskeletal protein RodZ
MSHYEKPDENDDLFLLGEQLREVREAQGLSYEDVAKSTHVRPHILSEIEDGRLDGIAAPIYVRGFIKTYCEFLMAQDLWKKYSALLISAEPPRSSEGSVSPIDISYPRPVFRRTSIVWVYIVLVIAVLGATFLLWNQHKNPDKAMNGFFLRFSQPQTEQPPQSSQISIQESPLPEETPDLAAAVSDEAQSEDAPASSVLVEQIPAPGAPRETAVSAERHPRDASADLSWLDGGETAAAGHEITVPQSLIPDQRLLIEVTAPVRLIVQQGGTVLTRRNLTAGGVRSYDVTISTPVSLSAGNAADVTWYGKRYAPIGDDGKPLALTFNPDGTVHITGGSSPHFADGSPNARAN